MGLNTNSPSRTFLSISDGKIAQRFNEQVPESIQCTNKDGTKTWYEKRYASISGRIKSVEKKQTDFGFRLVIVIEDNGEFQLEMPWSSRYSNGFFNCMPNIDFSKEVTFSPWMKIVNGDKKVNLYINQHNGVKLDTVPWFWTKDNPGDLPQMKQITVKGVEVWDDTDRQNYFERYIENNVRPKLGNDFEKPKTIEVNKPIDMGNLESFESDTDLPF